MCIQVRSYKPLAQSGLAYIVASKPGPTGSAPEVVVIHPQHGIGDSRVRTQLYFESSLSHVYELCGFFDVYTIQGNKLIPIRAGSDMLAILILP